ncbi:DUF2231 domain-containing protein [Herpetosiphon geysericola]|uniref:DUF2231 domain-containing protein n=1 Tax=Herpetosiphon geysericola TaxID=70996 RepID=UPI0006C90455|nr:DUF2231 domain-containing protein [Herpetosiphon geysericola]
MLDLAQYHPLLVHAPLILLPTAILLRVLHLIWPKAGFRITAIVLLVAGVGLGILAKESGEAAEHAAEARSANVEAIQATGTIPTMFGEGSLLETHASLAETTVIVFMLLLISEALLLFLSQPFFARWRGSFSLPIRLHKPLEIGWVVVGVAAIALVVLTGHYGGKLVYEHGVGISLSAMQ